MLHWPLNYCLRITESTDDYTRAISLKYSTTCVQDIVFVSFCSNLDFVMISKSMIHVHVYCLLTKSWNAFGQVILLLVLDLARVVEQFKILASFYLMTGMIRPYFLTCIYFGSLLDQNLILCTMFLHNGAVNSLFNYCCLCFRNICLALEWDK